MPRDRHKKYPKKPAEQLVKPSPAAQALINKIALGGIADLKNDMDLFERILIASGDLAKEPEFADITISSDKAAEVSVKWLERYEQPLTEAKKKGEDEFNQVYDDARIHIIDELATPGFRGLIKKQLQAFTERCIAENDLKNLELALYLEPILRLKEIPWGIIGLITFIYARTMKQALEPVQAQMDLFATMEKTLEEIGEDPALLEKMMTSPDEFRELAEKLYANNPRLKERAEELAWDVVEEFEHKLFIGTVDLRLFSDEEIDRTHEQVDEEVDLAFSDKEHSPEAVKQLVEKMRQALNEIMTPERYQRFRQDVETAVETWKQEQNQWAGALLLELDTLDDEYEINSFIFSAFAGQLLQGKEEEKPAGKRKKR